MYLRILSILSRSNDLLKFRYLNGDNILLVILIILLLPQLRVINHNNFANTVNDNFIACFFILQFKVFDVIRVHVDPVDPVYLEV